MIKRTVEETITAGLAILLNKFREAVEDVIDDIYKSMSWHMNTETNEDNNEGSVYMQRVAEFEKVSYEQFASDMKGEFYSNAKDMAKVDEELKKVYEGIQLPVRATSGSAGYDFKAPFSFTLFPGKTIKIPTGVRVRIDEGWWLGCLPRSGLGFKYRLQLNNTMGVIDSDYYFSDNEGHIFAKITNDSNTNQVIDVKAGDGFIQALFIPYGITYQDDVKAVRNGGMGSTDVPNS